MLNQRARKVYQPKDLLILLEDLGRLLVLVIRHGLPKTYYLKDFVVLVNIDFLFFFWC